MNKFLALPLWPLLIAMGCAQPDNFAKNLMHIDNMKIGKQTQECKNLYYEYLTEEYSNSRNRYYSKWVTECIE